MNTNHPPDIRALLTILGHRPIAFHRAFAELTGSVNAGLMLSQALYWTERKDGSEGWFFKTQSDWQKETFLTRHEQDAARLRLRNLGILREELRGVPAKMHYRIDLGTLQTRLSEIGNQDCRDSANQFAGNRQTVNKEITSENTDKDKSAPIGAEAARGPRDEEFFLQSSDESGGKKKKGDSPAKQLHDWWIGRCIAVFPGWKYQAAKVRDGAIARFIKKHGRDEFNRLLETVQASDFLMARNGFEKDKAGFPRTPMSLSKIFGNTADGQPWHEIILTGKYSNAETLSWKPENQPASFTAEELTDVWIESQRKSIQVLKTQVGSGGCRYWPDGKKNHDGIPVVIDNGPGWNEEQFRRQEEDYYRRHPEERQPVAA